MDIRGKMGGGVDVSLEQGRKEGKDGKRHRMRIYCLHGTGCIAALGA